MLTENKYFEIVPSPEEEGWLKDNIDLDSEGFGGMIKVIAKELECEIEDLGFCSLYESDFTDTEIDDFEEGLPEREGIKHFYKDEWKHNPYTFGYYLKSFSHTKYGSMVSETVNDTGGTVTNFWINFNQLLFVE